MAVSAPAFSIGRFEDRGGEPFTAIVVDGKAVPIASVVRDFSDDTTLDDLLEDWPANLKILKSTAAACKFFPDARPLGDLKALSPIARPRQIFCAGANYGRHVVEMMVAVGLGPVTEQMNESERREFGKAYVDRQKRESDPYVFMIPVTALAGPQDDLVMPDYSGKLDWELELGVVIGRPAHRVLRGDAASVVAGYVVVNDVTARDKVKRSDPGAIGPDWIASKGGPGFLPAGPLFVPAEFVANPNALALRLTVNGQVMQDDSTADMIFGIDRQIEHISKYVKLLPGDLLCTGSPAGNGVGRGIFLKEGDVIEAEIEGLGKQKVRCIAAPRGA